MFKFLSESNLSQKNGVAGIVSTKDWLKFMCLGFLSLIPLVGPFIYLGVLIYLMVNQETAESVKGYLKASLIIAAIAIVLSIILAVVMSSVMIGMFSALSL